MKVGDLIRVNMACPIDYEELHGQLGVIIGHSSLPPPGRFSQWKVRLVNGKLFWFNLDELERL